MRAAVINKYGNPDVFELVEVEQPVIEKENDVLIRVFASSINPVDWKIRKGNLKLILGSSFPIILGFDACGEVVDVGSKVTRFKKGDIVYGCLDKKYGKAYAEYALGTEGCFALKPSLLNNNEAASLPLAALTALQGLRDKGNIKEGDRVLINGAAGGVGFFAVQLVTYYGAHCTAISSERHIKLINKLKPEVFIDYKKEDFKLRDDKYNIIYDIVGTESFLTCKHLLNKGGVYITTLPRPKVLLHKLVSLFTGKKVKTLLMKANATDMEFINTLIEQRKFKTEIDKTFPLNQIKEAHAYSQEGHAEGKIVIEIGGDR